MGSRRVSRKRLYNVEKAGISVDLESGTGIKDAVGSATQHRQGQEIITEIYLDLAPASGAMVRGGDTGQAIGETATGSNYAYITELTEAKYGIITEIRMVCVEAPSADGGTADLDLIIDASGAKDQGDAISGVNGPATLTVKGDDASADIDDFSTISGKYLYIVDGATGSSGAMESGKFLIYLHGFVAPDDLA